MNLLCKLGFHKWEEHTEAIEWKINLAGLPIQLPSQNSHIKMNVEFRTCSKCLKKQVNKDGMWYRPEIRKLNESKWKACENTKEEKREIALRKLNIK
jgi:hypothetical protein